MAAQVPADRGWLELDAIEQRGKRYTLPFADAAPSLDAVMPRYRRLRRRS